MTGWLKVYAVSTVAFFAIDMLWLGVLSRNFYRRQLGGQLADQVNWAAAIVFYLLYTAGIVFFVTLPAARSGSLARALATGGVLRPGRVRDVRPDEPRDAQGLAGRGDRGGPLLGDGPHRLRRGGRLRRRQVR